VVIPNTPSSPSSSTKAPRAQKGTTTATPAEAARYRFHNQTWHYASDDLTKEMEQHEVTNRDAYILFYERSSK
jgi:hypothetical protein